LLPTIARSARPDRSQPRRHRSERIARHRRARRSGDDSGVDSLESFEPEIRRVFAAPKRGI
jgi:hypothetical protein